MHLFRNPSFLALVAVLVGGALVGLPRVVSFSENAELQGGQIQDLKQEVQRLTNMQLEMQGGIVGYRDALEKQSDLILTQTGRLKVQEMQLANGFLRLDGLRDSVNAQAVLAASAAPIETPSMRRKQLRKDILRPVFQVTGDDAVGSAVLIYHGKDEQGAYYLALSAYHVLRDIVANDDGIDPHAVEFESIFDQMEEGPVFLKGVMLAEKIDSDLALLRINTNRDLGSVAQLAPLERRHLVDAFSSVYTVGCPLGTNAQATRGEITRDDWVVDEQPYWMVSSPAYFGNSGGGVFLEETHELVGIFSKIYTHGNYRPQVITHMGLAVPLETIHAWLKDVGYGFLVEETQVNLSSAEEASAAPQKD
ncbi:MAG: serine protease [Planctomycetota bacterium]|nr:serine protease [Planctomycetota bacterium]MDA1114309.1 serine protease [Planctomycetota bacterium]